MKSTGAVQVIARDDRERARLPVSDSIIMPLHSMIISPQRAMVVGDINHPQQLLTKPGMWVVGVLSVKTVTSQVRDRTFIYILLCIFYFFFLQCQHYILDWASKRNRLSLSHQRVNKESRGFISVFIRTRSHNRTSCQLIAGSMEIPLKAVHMINSCFYPIGVTSMFDD